MFLRSLTDPHVEVGSFLATVLQHQVGVPVIKGSHLGGIQRHCLHLLHPPHSEARLPDLWTELTWGCLEGEHTARRKEEEKTGKMKGKMTYGQTLQNIMGMDSNSHLVKTKYDFYDGKQPNGTESYLGTCQFGHVNRLPQKGKRLAETGSVNTWSCVTVSTWECMLVLVGVRRSKSRSRAHEVPSNEGSTRLVTIRRRVSAFTLSY